jgi:hypothetical protein
VADPEYKELVRLGPFKGVDYTDSDNLLEAGRGASASNTNTARIAGALVCERGRVLMYDFSKVLSVINVIYAAVGNSDTPFVLVQGESTDSPPVLLTLLYNVLTRTYVQYTGVNTFTQAVQYGAVVYTNGGQRFFLSPSPIPLQAYDWQYSAPNAAGNVTLTAAAGTLAIGTYFYVITRQTIMPDGSISETSVDLNEFENPPQITLSGAGGVTVNHINGLTWIGTNDDGTAFTTNLYRQSSNQAGYLLVTNLTTNAAYTDTTSDQDLLANAELEVNRDPPPVGPGNLGHLCLHKSRVWCFVVQRNASTQHVTQVQLWYSNLDRPWEFDSTSQVLLLQGDITSVPVSGNVNYFARYGNQPAGLGVVGTILLALTRRQTWAVYGDSSSDFLQRQLFNIGCSAPRSITPVVGGAFWLSENGVYFFDGSSPTYDSEKIASYLRKIPGSPGAPGSAGISTNAQIFACGSFYGLSYYLHFPSLQQTIGYHTPSGEWMGVLPYAPRTGDAVCTTAANPSSVYGLAWNEVLAARRGAPVIDWYFADDSLDLGLPQTCSWTGGAMFAPDSFRKQYRYLTLIGPVQQGSAIVTFDVDDGVAPPKQVVWAIPDLSVTPRNIKSLGSDGGQLMGFMGSLTVALTGVAGQPAPQIWAVAAWGVLPPDQNLSLRT